MTPSITIDTREFQRTLNQYASLVKDSLPDVLNKKMGFILRRAQQLTPIADRSKLLSDLAKDVTIKERTDKKGKLRRSYKIRPGPLAFALVQATRRRAGEKGLSGKELGRAARALVARRNRAVGSERQGWSNALKAYRMTSEGGPRVKAKGWGKPAQPGWKPKAEATYNLNIRQTSAHAAGIDPRVESALADAFTAEAHDMAQYIERKIKEDAARAGIKAV